MAFGNKLSFSVIIVLFVMVRNVMRMVRSLDLLLLLRVLLWKLLVLAVKVFSE